MKRILVGVLLVASASMAIAKKPEALSVPYNETNPFINADGLKEIKYPSYLAGEGNIYGCHYGIRYVRQSDYSPNAISILEGSLLEKFPDIRSHKVVVSRFDVFFNNKEPSLRAASSAISAGLSGSMGGTWVVNEKPSGEVIGCPDLEHGEYFRSEILPGFGAIVIYMHISIDGQESDIRYVFPTNSKGGRGDYGVNLQSAFPEFLKALTNIIEEKGILKSTPVIPGEH